MKAEPAAAPLPQRLQTPAVPLGGRGGIAGDPLMGWRCCLHVETPDSSPPRRPYRLQHQHLHLGGEGPAMDQICLVAPILPSRTADVRDFMSEPETGRSTGYRRAACCISGASLGSACVYSPGLGLSLGGWLGARSTRGGVSPVSGPSRWRRTTRGGRGPSSGTSMARLAPDGQGGAPAACRSRGEPQVLAAPHETDGEVGNAEDW